LINLCLFTTEINKTITYLKTITNIKDFIALFSKLTGLIKMHISIASYQ